MNERENGWMHDWNSMGGCMSMIEINVLDVGNFHPKYRTGQIWQQTSSNVS